MHLEELPPRLVTQLFNYRLPPPPGCVHTDFVTTDRNSEFGAKPGAVNARLSAVYFATEAALQSVAVAVLLWGNVLHEGVSGILF